MAYTEGVILRGLEEVVKGVKTLEKQVKFATMVALNRVATLVRKNEQSTMLKVFDRPKPFTVNSLFIKPATKTWLEARVNFKEFAGKGIPAGKYLEAEIFGGPRREKRMERALGYRGIKGYALPSYGAFIDQHGNIKGSQVTQLLSRLNASMVQDQNRSGSSRSRKKQKASNYFVIRNQKTNNQVIMLRQGDEVHPVLTITTQAPTYSKRFPFYEVGQDTVRKEYDSIFKTAYDQAIATAFKHYA